MSKDIEGSDPQEATLSKLHYLHKAEEHNTVNIKNISPNQHAGMAFHTSNGAPQPQALSSKMHSLKIFKFSQGRVVREILNIGSSIHAYAVFLFSKQEQPITQLRIRCFIPLAQKIN
jgi:hypothetical protein